MMSAAPSIWPQAAASPPGNESGPTSCKVEPAKHAGKRSKNSTPAGAGVKREPVNELLQTVDTWKLEGVDPVRRANLERIAEFIGELPVDVLLRGSYELHFPKGAPCVFTIRALMSPSLWTEEVIRARKSVPKAISREKLRDVAQAIIDAAREVATATEEDETRSWVLQNAMLDDDALVLRELHDGSLVDDERVRFYVHPKVAACWREGEVVLLHLPRLIAALRVDGIRSLSMRDLSARIGRIGFESTQRGFRAKSSGHSWEPGQLIKARLWEIERDLLTGDSGDSDLELIEEEGGEE